MSKYLSWIGVLLVLVGFHLGPNAEAQYEAPLCFTSLAARYEF